MEANLYQTPDATLENGLVYCRDCGNKVSHRAKTCPSCGSPQAVGGKSKVAAGLLAIFLGGLGIHRFYLRQWWGLFYLLFCWTGIPGLIAFIEGIVFLCTSEDNWNEKYGHLRGGSVLGLVLAVIIGVMVLGMLSAIAIPAYQDYVHRAQMQR